MAKVAGGNVGVTCATAEVVSDQVERGAVRARSERQGWRRSCFVAAGGGGGLAASTLWLSVAGAISNPLISPVVTWWICIYLWFFQRGYLISIESIPAKWRLAYMM